MHIELKHLQLVQYIANLGSLSKCAEAMNITQPAASHLLKNLEIQVGASVFNRVNKKMIITGAGKTILQAAQEILPRVELCKQQLQMDLADKKGQLKISTECVTSYHWLPGILNIFENIYPNVEVEIEVEATGNPIKYLLEGKIDLALVIDPITNGNLIYYELFEDEILLVVGSSHRLGTKRYIVAKDLKDETYFMYKEAFENNTVARKVLIPANVKPNKISKLQLTEAIIGFVGSGTGVTTMSNWLLKPFLSTSQLKGIRITKKGLFRKWYIVTRESSSQSYTKDFISCFISNFTPDSSE